MTIIQDSTTLAVQRTSNIIGRSDAIQNALKRAQNVAPTNATVLIYGEPDTGKELIARAIHALSSYRDGAFVKANCSTISSEVIENELFGPEQKTVAGAIPPKASRMEQARGGTLFLKEAGEIPLELQPRLLRILQARENKGAEEKRVQPFNVRIIAASSSDLQVLAQRQFRSDLYQRLNVFPIYVPSLRERLEDIPLLVQHFANKYAAQMSKQIQIIPPETIQALQNYHWPGNIRELERFIQRAVIVSSGKILTAPLSQLKALCNPSKKPANNELQRGEASIDQSERADIVKALDKTYWVIGGPNGAAQSLNMNQTALISKMEKLGIFQEQEAECLSS